jgi:putative PIN family toxin of toxin-antitoxin system
MKVVIDTNVWVSGLLKPTNPPGQVLKAIGDKRITAVSSAHLWAELQRAVSYRGPRRALERDGVWPAVEMLLVNHSDIELVDDVTPTEQWVPGDTDDDWVIQCAITAKADYIISGDKVVLGLGEIEGIHMMSAAQFVGEILNGTP